MSRFERDNTEGYTDEQLAELNRRFDLRCDAFYSAMERRGRASDLDKSQLDRIAEMVQAAYDTELSAGPETEAAWATESGAQEMTA